MDVFLTVETLQPSIVLYGEENPDAEMIGRVTQADLSSKPDLMIIAGTSLKVHGLKRIVKSFAASIHAKGGKVIYITLHSLASQAETLTLKSTNSQIKERKN